MDGDVRPGGIAAVPYCREGYVAEGTERLP